MLGREVCVAALLSSSSRYRRATHIRASARRPGEVYRYRSAGSCYLMRRRFSWSCATRTGAPRSDASQGCSHLKAAVGDATWSCLRSFLPDRSGPLLDPWTHERLRFIGRSEEHTSEIQSLMRLSYAVFC